MFIQATIKNFRCFKDEIKLSLIASNYDKSTRKEDNLFHIEKFNLKLLKSAVVYGANASGKTKLIEGLSFMKDFILKSSKESQIYSPINVTPFVLSTETEHENSTFEIIFTHKDIMYRYGFELNSVKVHAEWLYQRANVREVELFYRDGQEFELNEKKFKVADLIANDRVRENALLLSVAANWNDKLAKEIFEWLDSFNIISGIQEDDYEKILINKLKTDKTYKSDVLKFLNNADLGIEDLKIYEELFQSKVRVLRRKYDENNLLTGLERLSMEEAESAGTRKYFALSGPVLKALQNGEILIVDELANKLHPNLTCKLIEVFNSKEMNPKNAQLVFNTHDTNLLDSGLFRRDQIWFTEKDRYGVSSLYSLANFKNIRKDDNFEKSYIKGKYGAVPYLGDFNELFTF